MNIIEDTKAEWRELGFFYDRNDQKKEWLFQGDREGLLKLADLFRRYGKNEKNRSLFEHDHYGPYMYFKVIMSLKREASTRMRFTEILKISSSLGRSLRGEPSE